MTYDLPDGYTVATPSDRDLYQYPSPSSNKFEGNNIKELFIAILYQPKVIELMKNDVTFRVFGFEEKDDLYNEIGEAASNALQYFQENIGPYPFTIRYCHRWAKEKIIQNCADLKEEKRVLEKILEQERIKLFAVNNKIDKLFRIHADNKLIKLL